MDNIPPVPPTCPQCHEPTRPEWYFCPNCGKELNAKPVTISVLSQVGIYALSIFLPPLGLYPAIKYLGKDGKQAKTVGWIALGLTLLSSVITIWLTFQFLQVYLSTITPSLNGL